MADQLLGRTDLVGKVATRAAPAINRVVGVEARTVRRRLLASAHRGHGAAPPAAFRAATVLEVAAQASAGERSRPGAPRHGVPDVSRRVPAARDRPRPPRRLRRNGIACEVARLGCCGAPWLTAGDTERFAAQRGTQRQRTLAAAIRAGTDVVVAQPTCHAVITTDYVDHVGGADAELVAARTFDAVTYLADHVAERSIGSPPSVTQHASTAGRCRRGCVAHRPPRTVRPARRRDPVAGPRLLELTGANGRPTCTGARASTADGGCGSPTSRSVSPSPASSASRSNARRRRGHRDVRRHQRRDQRTDRADRDPSLRAARALDPGRRGDG